MEKYHLKEDVKILCLPVLDFPAGINEAFVSLATEFPAAGDRTYYGISWMDDTGNIVYKAAAQETARDKDKSINYESFALPKGTYFTETLKDWRKNLQCIKDIFEKMM